MDEPDLKMATADTDRIVEYLRRHREVTSVLITGADPMIMGAEVLRRYVEPILDGGLEHIESVRIGSKSLAYWPQRFGCSRRSWRPAGAWPSWLTSPTRASLSRRWWPKRCAGSGALER